MLEVLRPYDLADMESIVRSAVQDIAAAADYPELMSEVEERLSNGSAVLYGTEDKTAFSIQVAQRYQGARALLLWVSWQKGGKIPLSLFRQDVLKIADDIGAKYLVFWTARKGFKRVAPAHGFIEAGKENQFTIWVSDLRK